MTPIEYVTLLGLPVAIGWYLWNVYHFQVAYRREFGEEFRFPRP